MRRLINFIKKVISIYMENNAGRGAAELAYFLTLSLFPLLYCLNAMLSRLGLTSREIVEWGNGLIPASALGLFADYTDYVRQNYNPAMLAGALMLMAASGSAAFRTATGITRKIMGAETRKGGFKRYFLSFVYAAGFLIAVYAAIIIILVGGGFPEVRFVLLYVILLAAVWGIYRVSAPGTPHFPGAFAAATALVLTGMVFSLTVETSVRYATVYGSIYALVILMLWLSACGNILIFGGIINAVLSKSKSDKNLL